jgi:signal transduction histidine kinase
VPLLRDGAWVASFWVSHHEPRRWSAEEVSLVSVVADRVRLAVDNARYAEALREQQRQLEVKVAERTAELGRTHEQLRLAERMAGLGTLAAGLGHDMANLLMPIQIRMHVLRTEELPPKLRADLDALAAPVAYLQTLSRSLRLLAQDAVDPKASAGAATDLAAWWKETQPLLRAVLPAGVRLETDFGSEPPVVAAAPHQLTQVIFNLVQNAGDAFREAQRANGEVRIGAVALAESAETEVAEGLVRISVQDNGPGMAADVRRRCLEPFFSTKDRHLSGGMGLSLVRAIVSSLGGSIDLHSERGAGTTVVFTVPRAPLARTGESDAQRAAPVQTAVLSVSDPRLRAYLVWALRAAGVAPQLSNGQRVPSHGVWVVDREFSEAAAAFASKNGCWAVVLDAPAATSSPHNAHSEQDGTERIIYAGARPTSAALREVLEQVSSSVSGAAE